MGRTAKTGSYVAHPAARYRDRIRLVQGRRQQYPDRWEAQFKLEDGRWAQPVSLKTDDIEDAKTISIELLIQREAGVLPASKRPSHTLRDISAETIARLKAEQEAIEASRGPNKGRKLALKIGLIKRVLLPQFGDTAVTEITEPVLSSWLKTYKVHGAKQGSAVPVKPKRSTIGNINGAYQELMRDAYDRGWITKAQIQRLDQKRFSKGERRPSFTVSEMRQLARQMSDEWIAAGHTRVVREDRYLLRAMVALLAVTGLRPGDETATITFEQIDADALDSRGRKSVRIFIRAHQGKRDRSREIWLFKSDKAWPQGEQIFRAFLDWLADNTTEEAQKRNPKIEIFRRPSDGAMPNYPVAYRHALKEFGLRRDPLTGMDRSLYSLRHYYATEAIHRGLTTAQLVGQMGTTIQMLDQHYAHVTQGASSAQATGSDLVDRRKWEAARVRRQSGGGQKDTQYPDGEVIEDSEDDGREERLESEEQMGIEAQHTKLLIKHQQIPEAPQRDPE